MWVKTNGIPFWIGAPPILEPVLISGDSDLGVGRKLNTRVPQVLVLFPVPFWGYPIFDPQPFGHGSKPF